MATKKKRQRTRSTNTQGQGAATNGGNPLKERRPPNLPARLLADIDVIAAACGLEVQLWIQKCLEEAVRKEMPKIAQKLAQRAHQLTGAAGDMLDRSKAAPVPAGYSEG